MQISDTEVKKILTRPTLAEEIDEMAEAQARAQDAEMVDGFVASIVAMPDREDRIAELRARIEAGTYRPTGAEIVDSMIRRSIADHYR